MPWDVGEQERQGGSAVADCEGIRSDDGSGDRSEDAAGYTAFFYVRLRYP